MNGVPVPRGHGAPARLVVPGWYAMASVKWLERLTRLREPFRGPFQAEHYVYRDGTGRPAGPVTHVRVKSQIVSPAAGARLPAGRDVEVRGVAWSASGIAGVRLSVDGGASWHEADLGPDAGRGAWRAFRWTWRAPPRGQVSLMSRARDAEGNEQPLEPVWNALGYGYNAVVPVRVRVE